MTIDTAALRRLSGSNSWLIAVLALVLLSAPPAQPRRHCAAPDGEWLPIFNGRDLSDWTPKIAKRPLGDNFRNTFRVEGGRLIVSYDQYPGFEDHFGHLFYVGRQFSHYWIRAEYRFVDEQVAGAPGWGWRNNGLMLHSQPPESMSLEQEQPVSVEVRLLGGNWRQHRPTASLCLIQTSAMVFGKRQANQCINSHGSNHYANHWILVEAEVQGGRLVRHFVNGEKVMEYSHLQLTTPQPWARSQQLESGYIAIQAETHPIEFRRIEILNLSAS